MDGGIGAATRGGGLERGRGEAPGVALLHRNSDPARERPTVKHVHAGAAYSVSVDSRAPDFAHFASIRPSPPTPAYSRAAHSGAVPQS